MSDHLVVLVHGLWGNPEHMWYIKKALSERHEKIDILVSDTNIGNRTYDGIDVCGERIAKEVRDRVAARKEKNEEITKVSFVGYSLGGLGARYAIGVLNSTDFFDTVKPVSYTTFATPHCGVSPTTSGFFSWLVGSIGPKTLSVTGSHIFLADGVVKKRPLLESISDPEGVFYKGLQKFERRTCYANIINDRSVPCYTAAISPIDPYADLTKINLNHDDEYGGVLLDHEKPFVESPDPVVVTSPSLTSRELLFRGVMLAGLPIWLTLYSANAVVANYASGRRIAEHRSTESGESTLSSMTQDVVEEIMDADESKEPSTLTLNAAQKSIIRNLNGLEWNKYFVHIQKTQHSHAAIVCRTKDSERLTEGHHVMRHWLDKVFVV